MESLKIAIVEDDPSLRDALSTFMSMEGHSVVSFQDGVQFLKAFEKCAPDIAILDLQMPNKSGLDVLRELPEPYPFPCLMMSAHGDISAAVQAIKYGAFDFLEKPVLPDELLEKIELAVKNYSQKPVSNPSHEPVNFAVLTDRENAIAKLLYQGLSNKEAAIKLDISHRTIEVHRAKIFEKLEVRNIAELVRLFLAK